MRKLKTARASPEPVSIVALTPVVLLLVGFEGLALWLLPDAEISRAGRAAISATRSRLITRSRRSSAGSDSSMNAASISGKAATVRAAIADRTERRQGSGICKTIGSENGVGEASSLISY
jgi:hypothetical protein